MTMEPKLLHPGWSWDFGIPSIVQAWPCKGQAWKTIGKVERSSQHWDHHWSEDYLQKLKTFEGRNSCTCLALPWMTLQKMIKHVQHWEHHWSEDNLPKLKTFKDKNFWSCLALAWTTFTQNDQSCPALGLSLISKISSRSVMFQMLDILYHS